MIRPLQEQDIESLKELSAAEYKKPAVSVGEYAEAYVCETNGKLVGFYCWRPHDHAALLNGFTVFTHTGASFVRVAVEMVRHLCAILLSKSIKVLMYSLSGQPQKAVIARRVFGNSSQMGDSDFYTSVLPGRN